MAVYKQLKSKNWWYKFTWNGEVIRKSTKQTNKRVAEQMEAAHRTSLAKGEVGIRDKKTVPTLRAFAEGDFKEYVEATFQSKPNTATYYKNGIKNLVAFERLSDLPLTSITTEHIAAFSKFRMDAGLAVSSVNRELQALRRMFALAVEWGRVERNLPKVRMLSGERHRERVLTREEQDLYFDAASSNLMQGHAEPPLAYDVGVILLDCALRPEECFRLTWHNIRDGGIEIEYGKTDNARRRIPFSDRVASVLEMRRHCSGGGEWVFPAPTKSGHIEPSSLKKQHLRACKGFVEGPDYAVEPFPLYTFRHTCLTQWAPHMDPWTLHKLAGHRDMSITKRYIHPQDNTVRDAIERARSATGGHTSWHTPESVVIKDKGHPA